MTGRWFIYALVPAFVLFIVAMWAYMAGGGDGAPGGSSHVRAAARIEPHLTPAGGVRQTNGIGAESSDATSMLEQPDGVGRGPFHSGRGSDRTSRAGSRPAVETAETAVALAAKPAAHAAQPQVPVVAATKQRDPMARLVGSAGRQRTAGGGRRVSAVERMAILAQWLDDAAVRLRSNIQRSVVVLYAQGWAAAQDARHAEAVDSFGKVLERIPDHVPSLMAQAESLVVLRRFDEAAEVYQVLARLAPADMAVQYNFGVVLCRQARYTQAAERFRMLVRLAPDHARGWYNLAALAQREGRIGEARQAWLAFVGLRPDVAEAWFNLGVAWMDFEDPGRAAECFARVVELAPADVAGWLNLASASAAADDFPAALDALNKARDAAPNEPIVLRHLAALHGIMADRGDGDVAEHHRLAASFEQQAAAVRAAQPTTTPASRPAEQPGALSSASW